METWRLRFTTFLAPNMLPVYQCVADYVAERLGCETVLSVGVSFEQFARDEADVGFICGLPYVKLRRQDRPPVELLAAPVLQGERYQDRSIYFSDVIVHRDSPFHTFADLRHRSWAYNDLDSHSGYNLTRYHLVRLGETRGYFGRVIEAGYHQRAIRMVCRREVDAAAIDSQVLAIELRDHPDLVPQLRIIQSLGPSTIQPVVVAAHVPDRLKADLQASLLAAGHDPATRRQLAHGFVHRFAAVTDAHYDDIRAMLAAAEVINFLTIR